MVFKNYANIKHTALYKKILNGNGNLHMKKNEKRASFILNWISRKKRRGFHHYNINGNKNNININLTDNINNINNNDINDINDINTNSSDINLKNNFKLNDHPSKYSSYNYVRGINKRRENAELFLGAVNSFLDRHQCNPKLHGFQLDQEAKNQLAVIVDGYGLCFDEHDGDLVERLRIFREKLSGEMHNAEENEIYGDETSNIVKSVDKKQNIIRRGIIENENSEEENPNYLSLEYFYF